MIKFENVCYAYDNKSVIKDLSFSIEQGTYQCFVGRNGSGKSTVSKLIAGLLIPQKGKITINGYDTSDHKDLAQIRRLVGIIFQNPEDQIITTTVIDEVIFGLENIGVSRELMMERANQALQAVGLLEYKDRQTFQLSGGEKQRLTIASVLAMQVKTIIFDESIAMIDPKGRKKILEIMKKLHEYGTTIIHITHDMNEVLDSSNVIVLSEGMLVYKGLPKDLFNEKNIIEKNELEIPFIIKIKHFMEANGIKTNGANTIEDLVEIIHEYII